ncbi:hypothetical protein PVIIG_05338 [Plasmodium vivax India VII]|uniref:Uncharacterized protein n=1 Tax=Plasmodium vivax India VII TaxID=1077284 RepID=A0A0J9UUK1_PLAVI|nr:hypothetical protein PVIIG_05338 [Plasmodium vivax India VII]
MLFLNNTRMRNKLYLTFFYNIVSIILLSRISHRGNEISHLNKYLNIKYNDGSTWKLRNNRLLKNDGPKSETGENSKSDNITLPGEQNILKDNTGSPEIYAKINKDTTNSMYAYIKKLEQGYHNKKGLKRLDCLYEKKLFNEMYKLDKIAGNMKKKGSCSNCNVIENIILGSNGIIYFPLVIAFLSFIIYTTSKVKKYKRLKKIYCI